MDNSNKIKKMLSLEIIYSWDFCSRCGEDIEETGKCSCKFLDKNSSTEINEDE